MLLPEAVLLVCNLNNRLFKKMSSLISDKCKEKGKLKTRTKEVDIYRLSRVKETYLLIMEKLMENHHILKVQEEI